MTSNDNFVTVDVFNARMDRLEAINEKNLAIIDGKLIEIRSEISDVRSEIANVRSEIKIVNQRIDNTNLRLEDMKFFMSIGFAVITILITIVALMPIISKFLQWVRKPSMTEEKVQSMIEKNMSINQSFANMGK